MNTAALTQSQRNVVAELIKGKTNWEIACALGRSEKTVKAHLTRIFQLTGCKNRIELVVLMRPSSNAD